MNEASPSAQPPAPGEVTGPLDRAADRLYRRTGRRYTAALRGVLTAGGLLLALGAVGGTAVFVDMTLPEFLALMAVSALGYVSEIVVMLRLNRHAIGRLREWTSGRRDEETGRRAWAAAARLAVEILRQRRLYALGAVQAAAWDALAVVLLGLPAETGLLLFAGGIVVYLYAASIRFFLVELAMRPLMRDIAAAHPDQVLDAPRGVSLRVRLMVALSILNVITGLTVAGVATENSDDLRHLGVGIAAAVAVALTISIWLAALLSDSILTPVGQLRSAAERVSRGNLDVRVPVASTDETGDLTRAFNAMVAGLSERERLRDAFGAFVDPGLTERVLSEGTDLAGEDVELSLLFMDIRGFTTFSESARARDVVATLNDLYGEVVPVILRHRGHANKFIGDGLLAVFGAPDRLPDHADRAVAAALEIADLVARRYRGDLRVGIGVNSGQVVVGTIGGGGRVDFTVIGDAVNTAARVESATRQTGDDVLITEATRRLLTANRDGWRERPPIPLKGKSKAVALFAPAGER